MSPTRVPRVRVPNYNAAARLVEKDGIPTELGSAALDGIQKFLRANGGTVYGTNAQRTDSSAVGYMSPGLFANGTLYVETDTGLVYQVRQGTWYWIAGTIISTYTLSAASTTINAPSEGYDWAVILTQDATGGRAIAWGSGIKAASTAIDTTASTISTFRFVKVGSDWYMTCQPTTGMTA